MFGWLRFRCLAFIIVLLALWGAGQAIMPARAAGKTVPKIAFVFYDKQTQTNILSIADPDGKNVVNLFKDGHFLSPVWSPDGTQLAFMGGVRFGASSDLYLVNSDGSNLRKIASHPGRDGEGYVTWSPDGTQLIYGVADSGYIFFYRINADGSGETELSFKDLPTGVGSAWIAWSADGKQVAVLGHLGGSGFQIYLADPNGANAKPLPVRLAVKTSVSIELAWSPDKQHMFVREFPFTSAEPRQLYVANVDGSNPKVILKAPKLPAGVSSLSVSPDGKQLLFVAVAPGDEGLKHTALWVANADGSSLHALPLRDLYDGGTSWAMVPQDKLPKGGPTSFREVAK